MTANHNDDRAEPRPTGIRDIQMPLLLVRCRRCRKAVALWRQSLNGHGCWEQKNEGCRCQPQPELPVGDELGRLANEALRKPPHPQGGARRTIFR